MKQKQLSMAWEKCQEVYAGILDEVEDRQVKQAEKEQQGKPYSVSRHG